MNKLYWVLGLAAAAAVVAYLSTKRDVEVHATVTAEDPTITYRGESDGVVRETTYIDDGTDPNHQRLLDLVDESNRAIAAYDAAHPPQN